MEEPIFRVEHEVHEVSYGTPRFAVGNQLKIHGIGTCTVHQVIVDTNEQHFSGFNTVKIVLRTPDTRYFTWRSIPLEQCILTFNALAQLEE
jgi:hypothetical protein